MNKAILNECRAEKGKKDWQGILQAELIAFVAACIAGAFWGLMVAFLIGGYFATRSLKKKGFILT